MYLKTILFVILITLGSFLARLGFSAPEVEREPVLGT
jgi:hypothetical protein